MLMSYRVVLYLAWPWLVLRLLMRALRDRRYGERLPQRFGFFGPGRAALAGLGGGAVWIHAVSVGEVNAATPVVDYVLKKYPRQPILLTTMTPTGADIAMKKFAGRVAHCYLPYDYPGAVRRFLAAARPSLGIIMETEIWPNLLARCAARGVPMVYVNARLSARSYRGYARVRGLIAPALGAVQHFAAQASPDAQRLMRLGASASAMSVTGNIKFDVAWKPSLGEAAQAVRRSWGATRPVWIAGSTHGGEEAQILAAFWRVRREFPALLLVIAPRHPPRCKAVLRLCAGRGYRAILRSAAAEIGADIDICVVDSMGELPMLLAASDFAFIGGSLVEKGGGGHNVLEAAAAGVPVLFGPHMFNFAEVADLLLRHGAGIQVDNAEQLAEATVALLRDPLLRDSYGRCGKKIITENRGALRQVCALLDTALAGKKTGD